jgi:hypothetical protein
MIFIRGNPLDYEEVGRRIREWKHGIMLIAFLIFKKSENRTAGDNFFRGWHWSFAPRDRTCYQSLYSKAFFDAANKQAIR